MGKAWGFQTNIAAEMARCVEIKTALLPLTPVDSKRKLPVRATAFIKQAGWLRSIEVLYGRLQIDPIFALYLVDCSSNPKMPPYIWVIVGDIPPAFLSTTVNPSAIAAVETYVAELRWWSKTLLEGGDMAECMPILHADSFRPLPPTPKTATMVGERADAVERLILPLLC